MSFREWLILTGILPHEVVPPPLSLKDLLAESFEVAEAYLEPFKTTGVSVIELFHRYLHGGYYPTFLEVKENWLLFETIRQSVARSIEHDIFSCHPDLTGKSLKKMRRLLRFLAEHCPFTPNLKTVKDALEISDETTLKRYLFYLHEAEIIREVAKSGETLSALVKPEKILLNNPTLLSALSDLPPNTGTLRETFVALALDIEWRKKSPEVCRSPATIPARGDFLFDGAIFEVGGKRKGRAQIRNTGDAWIIADDILRPEERKIPIWLFGFLW